MFKRKIISQILVGTGLVLFSSIGYTNSLKNVLVQSLVSDPILKEADAELGAAKDRVEQAKGGHYPVVSLTGSKILSQYHKDQSDYKDRKIVPGVRGSINLYAFGAIEKEVEKNKENEKYYNFKYYESREELAYTISELYLNALLAKERIDVGQRNLQRHNEILADIGNIVINDEGRESEYAQAEARAILVEQEINDYQRDMYQNLTQLASYSGSQITEKDLTDPFSKLSVDAMYKNYSAKDSKLTATYQAQMAELETNMKDHELSKLKKLPKIDLTATVTTEDREAGVNVNWDVFNHTSSYEVREKANLIASSKERLDRVERNLRETTNLAQLDIKRNTIQLKTIKKQIEASTRVIEFYRLQFDLARKTLIELLNAHSELFNVEMAQVNTQGALRKAKLDYLRSQGSLAEWAGFPKNARK
ncbi:TolC family protein [Testudinibacter sp. TR-2022]|nr:TolC family protein [Testudinibacter sp. TR-2022]TNH04776.1 TolC family protein [Pasteurellaceae bacterium Phil31]TNH10250.1 TolC family protein [Testudinibacter sp. TR-2022]TNH12133.1 TolC family protein [Testudinibacter sp. TR-2022]TNH12761.1 TolC family protein [Testudinibacter sp. TR-2022]TNH18110.1 TolC family protein [Testudinibacter sp. TR-2022]